MDFNAIFPYPRLLQGTDSIRLLRKPSIVHPNNTLRFTFSTFPLHSAPRYYALSYCWGSPFAHDCEEHADEGTGTDWTAMTRTVYCNGLPYRIAQNLYDGLLTIYETYDSFYLWVDQICISQANLAEKGAQIMLMGHIFSGAEQVLCWLGREDHCSVQAVEFVEIVSETLRFSESPGNHHSNSYWSDRGFDLESEQARAMMMKATGGTYPIGSPPPSLSHWKAFFCFCGRRWFRRLWVVQEYGLAKAPVFLCGTGSFSADTFELVVDYVAASSSGSALMKRYGLRRNPTFRVLDLMKASLRRWQADRLRSRLSAYTGITDDSKIPYAIPAVTIATTSELQCSDARDKVYALLGLAQLRTRPTGKLSIRAQYDIELSVLFYEVAIKLIRELPALICLSLVKDRAERRIKALPSWVPDLTAGGKNRLTSFLQKMGAGTTVPPSGPTSRVIDGYRLILEGTFVDEILECGLKMRRKHGYVSKPVLNNMLRLIQPMPPRYEPTGQDRLEALWRTLLHDYDMVVNSRATATTGASFPDWLVKSLIGTHSDNDRSWNKDDDNILANDLLELVKASTYSASWLSESSLKDLHLGYDKLTDPSHQPEFYQKAERFLGMGCKSKKLMRTSKNYLGFCRPSVEPGDQVWILRDASAAAVLRPVPESGTYEFMGDAYIHGFSHGEIFDLDPKFEKVTLV